MLMLQIGRNGRSDRSLAYHISLHGNDIHPSECHEAVQIHGKQGAPPFSFFVVFCQFGGGDARAIHPYHLWILDRAFFCRHNPWGTAMGCFFAVCLLR